MIRNQENRRPRHANGCCCRSIVVLVDQLTKAYISRHYGEFEFTTLLPVLDITRMHNVGAAFSFLAGASGWQRWLFIALAVGVEHRHRRVAVPDAAGPTFSWPRGSRWCSAGRSAT